MEKVFITKYALTKGILEKKRKYAIMDMNMK